MGVTVGICVGLDVGEAVGVKLSQLIQLSHRSPSLLNAKTLRVRLLICLMAVFMIGGELRRVRRGWL